MPVGALGLAFLVLQSCWGLLLHSHLHLDGNSFLVGSEHGSS